MSTMYISEYTNLAFDERGNVIQAGLEPSEAIQQITFTATSGASAAFGANTRFIRVSCDASAFLKFGVAPTSVTATDLPVQSNTPEFFGVKSGQKIAAVA